MQKEGYRHADTPLFMTCRKRMKQSPRLSLAGVLSYHEENLQAVDI
jgi:hypothetical protein